MGLAFFCAFAVAASITGGFILLSCHKSGTEVGLGYLAFFSLAWPIFWIAVILILLSPGKAQK